MIGAEGPCLMPATLGEGHHRSREGMAETGCAKLDEMLGGGLHLGSSLMVSGSSGTGKTTLVGQIAVGLCASGHKVTYLSLEQDASELIHDYTGVGIDVRTHLDTGALQFRRMRPVDCSLEEHLIRIARTIEADRPDVVVLDSITSLAGLDRMPAVKSMVLRLIDFCKSRQVMIILTELLVDSQDMVSELGLSSLLDAWIRVELWRQLSEFVRLIRVLKGRGAKTSPQIKEFRITKQGISIEDPYIGSGTFVFGTEKLIREHEERRETAALHARLERLRRELEMLPQTFDVRLQETALQRDKALAALQDEIEALETKVSESDDVKSTVLSARGGV
jgi:circadian clock protein KaiC